MYKYILFT